MNVVARVTMLAAFVCALGCSDDAKPAAGTGGNVSQGTGGAASSGGSVGGSVSGSGGAANDGGISDAGMMKTCPDYPHLPYDGEWVGEAVVTKSTCADMPVGAQLQPFATLTIVTSELDAAPPGQLDIKVTNMNGELFSGLVSDDFTIVDGPIEPGIQAADLTTSMFITFVGNCLMTTIVIHPDPRNENGCETRAYLYATRPNSPWK